MGPDRHPSRTVNDNVIRYFVVKFLGGGNVTVTVQNQVPNPTQFLSGLKHRHGAGCFFGKFKVPRLYDKTLIRMPSKPP